MGSVSSTEKLSCCFKVKDQTITKMNKIKTINGLKSFVIQEMMRVNKITAEYSNVKFTPSYMNRPYKDQGDLKKVEYDKCNYYINLGFFLLRIKNFLEEKELMENEDLYNIINGDESSPKPNTYSKKRSKEKNSELSYIVMTKEENRNKKIHFERSLILVAAILDTEEDFNEEELKVLSEDVEEKIYY